jgi:tetratricopeptide (TPR) repeat protein
MNVESFVNYLNNPSQLYQLSYQELKSLALEYPYCQNLWHLLLVKSQLEGHQDLAQNLEKASIYSVDRQHLFQILQDQEAPPLRKDALLLEEDEALELRDFNDAMEPLAEPLIPEEEGEEEKQAAVFPGEQTTDHNAAAPHQDETSTSDDLFFAPDFEGEEADPEPDMLELPDLIETIPDAAMPPPLIDFEHLARHFAGVTTVLERWYASSRPAPRALPKPMPKKAFRAYKPNRFQTIQIGEQLSASKGVIPKKKKKKKKVDPMVAFAEKSLNDSPEFATETLGQLLVDQGQYDKAREVYQRLIALYPQNEEHYQKTIEELNKLG